MAIKSTLTLGKKGFQSLDEIIKGAGSKFAGKGKKVVDLTSESKKKQLDKSKQNRQKRNQVSKKEYEKTLPDVLKKKPGLPSVIKSESIKSNKLKEKSTSLVPTGQSKTIKETVNPKKIKQNFTLQGKPVDKTIKQTKPNKSKRTGTSLVPTNQSKTTKNILSKSKVPLGIGTLSAIGTGAVLLKNNDSKVNAKEIKKEDKKVTPSKSIGPDTSKITKPSSTVKVQKQTLPQTKANDYTGKYLDKEGNVAYESFSDFIAHMSGKPKKRAMPEKTKRIIGEGNKLKKITAETKGAGKGVKYKAFSGGGLIAGLYDKPEKVETYKGNTSAGRQVKGYGKARKR